ncbi:MAG: pantetheine-phosphate adenylyltransferase [Candidatus Gallimonas sp.]
MKKCVFAGTFDPFTLGHKDTVDKCLRLFDEVVVAVAENKQKSCLFSLREREEMIRRVFCDEPRVKTLAWNGVIVDLLLKEGTPFYVRGIRNTVDLEYENADFFASRKLSADMIELYLPSEQEHLHISSTLVKNCIAFGKPFADYVPEAVFEYISEKTDV